MDENVKPEYLNNTVWCTIRRSPIHGVGVFAIRDIKKGQKLHLQGGTGKWLKTDLSKVIPEIRKLVHQRWPITKDGNPFLSPNDDALLISFINHSEDFNYDKFNDKAFNDIKKDEEITEHYGDYKDIINIK